MPGEIYFYKAEGISRLPGNLSKISRWLRITAEGYGYTIARLNYIFTTDSGLREMNKAFLDHDYETDVLTFDFRDQQSDEIIEGEIYISIERIRVQAKEYKTGFSNELMRIMVHGLLHLIGFDDIHEADRKKMREAEDSALTAFSI